MSSFRFSAIRRVARRPWIPETLVFALVVWQEAIRLELRTAGTFLPIGRGMTAFYYLNAGDFVNGFINAFLLDGVSEIVRSWRSGTRPDPAPQRRQAIVMTIASMLVIVAVELVPSALNVPDVRDIPAGLAGALLYLGIRWFGIRSQSRPGSDDMQPS